MFTKRILAVACGGLIAGYSTSVSATQTMTTSPAAAGEIVVDQTTGKVTYCIIMTGGTALAPTPTGLCSLVGTVAVSTTNPSLEVSAPFGNGVSGGGTVFVTNVYTGKVTQCEYYWTFNQGFYADCALIATVQ